MTCTHYNPYNNGLKVTGGLTKRCECGELIHYTEKLDEELLKPAVNPPYGRTCMRNN